MKILKPITVIGKTKTRTISVGGAAQNWLDAVQREFEESDQKMTPRATPHNKTQNLTRV